MMILNWKFQEGKVEIPKSLHHEDIRKQEIFGFSWLLWFRFRINKVFSFLFLFFPSFSDFSVECCGFCSYTQSAKFTSILSRISSSLFVVFFFDTPQNFFLNISEFLIFTNQAVFFHVSSILFVICEIQTRYQQHQQLFSFFSQFETLLRQDRKCLFESNSKWILNSILLFFFFHHLNNIHISIFPHCLLATLQKYLVY